MSEISKQDIQAFVDGQLDAADYHRVHQAIMEDAAVQSEFEFTKRLKTACSELPQHTCEKTLASCKERIAELNRVRRTETLVGKYSYAMAAVLLVAILAAAYVNRSAAGLMGRDMVSRTLSASAYGADVGNQDGKVAEWLRRQLKQDPDRIAPSQLRLQQVQRVFVDGRMLGRLVYTDGVTDYVLVIAPGLSECEGDPIPGNPGLYSMSVQDLNVVTWYADGASYALAAPKPVEALVDLIR